MRSAPAEIEVFARCSLLVVRLSLTVGVRRQLQQIPRVLDIAGATGEVTKADGAVAQVSGSEHERFWHTAGSDLLIQINRARTFPAWALRGTLLDLGVEHLRLGAFGGRSAAFKMPHESRS
jgi:hypothetical protein